MGVLSQNFREVSSVLARRATAPEQAGIFSGVNPSKVDLNDPIKLWVIQVIIIIAMTQFLATIGSRIRQPRVIAEVIGGVLLGPSVMGRIPGFSSHIFPTEAMPMLNLTSTIGLVLFLFLIGLEVDVRLIKRNVRSSMTISAAGLILPLGVGAALAIPIYHEFIDPSIKFGQFILFVAVAIGITAFPVLCRILTETRLLETTVGVVVLSAGVGNDVVGWILLALTVALVNSGSGITALWILLTAVGYTLFLLFPVKWAYRWVARHTGSLENGRPTTSLMTLTVILVFFSAFFTDIIGVHPIFGGFLAGLIIPHDNGLAIAMVEKIEDLVSVLFLPLYFAFSGLRTNLGLLDNGVTWGYTILIIVVAFFSKFIGCAVAAKLTGFNLRESGAIGVLMSCKGLVELIVLNVGLSAGVLDTRTFSMFVLHALVVTFATTPLTLWVYPPKHRVRDLAATGDGPSAVENDANTLEDVYKSRFTVVLDKLEQLPAVMTLAQLLRSANPKPSAPLSATSSAGHDEKFPDSSSMALAYTSPAVPLKPVAMDALRLIELTERTSDVLKSQEATSLIQSDPAISVIRTFGYLNRIRVSASLNILSVDEFPAQVAKHAASTFSQLVILPWSHSSSFGDEVESLSPTSPTTPTPFDRLFGKQGSGREQTDAIVHTQFIRRVFNGTPADVALFIDRGLPETYTGRSDQHIFLPFFGGQDDRLALSFVVQLCMNPSVSASIVRFTKVESDDITPITTTDREKVQAQQLHAITNPNSTVFPDTVYGARDTQTRLASDTADNMLWDRYAQNHDIQVTDALRRISFTEQTSARPLHAVLESAAATITQHDSHSRVMVAVGRSRRMAVESHSVELRTLLSERSVNVASELPKTLGDVGAAFVLTNAHTSLLVLQACSS